MLREAVTLRKAEASDVEEIRLVIHSQGIMWNTERIVSNMGELLVLICGKRILGVLCGNFIPGKEAVSWVAVHPMYPENTLSTAMVQTFWGVLCRKPVSIKGQKKPGRLSFKKMAEAVSSHFKFRGVNNGISGQ